MVFNLLRHDLTKYSWGDVIAVCWHKLVILAGDFYFQACRFDVVFEGEVGEINVEVDWPHTFAANFNFMGSIENFITG